MQEYIRNKYFLEQLVHHPEFGEIRKSISNRKVNSFKDIVMPPVDSDNYRFDSNVMLLHDLTKVVCKMIRHVEHKLSKLAGLMCYSLLL